MHPGEKYLLASPGGGLAFGTDFLSVAELSVVPIPADLDLARLTGKEAKQQVQLIFARYLYDVQQQLAPLQKTEAILQKAIADRGDDVYESHGNVRILETHEAATKNDGTIYLELPPGRMGWSQSAAGKSGYLYFKTHGADSPEWEFAPSDHREIKAFDGQPLQAKFYGGYSPSRDKRLGNQSSYNAFQIAVGQIVLARTVDDPNTIYILKIEKQQEQSEAMTARFATLKSE
jgi:hypothetical protein